jgi:hypothetical protein
MLVTTKRGILRWQLVVGLLIVALVCPANASVNQTVNMTFQSGATFSGQVTFADDYSLVQGVTGILSGYQYGIGGYQGAGSDSIGWVWLNGANFSTGTDNYSTFLMDGNDSDFSHWIQFAYNYSGAPTLEFTSGVSVYSTDNYVDYVDPMVSGSIGAGTVPEPSTLIVWSLLGAASIGLTWWRKRNAA